ncbi:MAG: hypothetical protein ABIT01_15745, partial [Thermoanaerobaculia bacterium]
AGSSSALAAGQDPTRPTPEAAEQHVTVPSLPGEPNKEGTVRADGQIQTDAAGYPRNDARPVVPATPGGPAAAEPTRSGPLRNAPAPGMRPPAKIGGANAPVTRESAVTSGASGSSSSATPGRSTFLVKGKIRGYENGRSIRIALSRSGRVLSYVLSPDAVTPGDLKVGDVVTLRIVNRGKARAVDLVERAASRR